MTEALIVTGVVCAVLGALAYRFWRRGWEQKIDDAVVLALQEQAEKLLDNKMTMKMTRQASSKARRPKRMKRR